MKEEHKASVQISEGWIAETVVSRNSSGTLVLTELSISAANAEAKEAGINSSVVRGLKISDLISQSISEVENFEVQLIGLSPYVWAEEQRLMWLAEIAGEWERKGPFAHDESLYAKTAFFYVIELYENRISPLQTLAPKLDVDRQTLARRIEKARKLGLLTSPNSKTNSSGIPGGALTDKALELLGMKIER
jgi:hypothetical protein